MAYGTFAVVIPALCGLVIVSSDVGAPCRWTRRPPAVTCRWRVIDADAAVVGADGHPLARHVTEATVRCSGRHFFWSRLSSETFAGLEKVRKLEIDQCKLIQLTSDALAPLTELRELRLHTGNAEWGLKRLTVAPRVLSYLQHLRRLDLGNNGIQMLDESALCGAQGLHWLSLAHNAMALCQTGLSGCASKLHHLDLSHNSIGELTSRCFTGLAQLRTLKLSHNQIRAIGATALAGLPHLRELHMASSGLHHVAGTAFAGNSELRSLELQGNRLTWLPEGALQNLRHLALLNLSGNALGSEENVTLSISGAHRLTVLDLSHNKLKSLPAIGELFSLQVLNLSNNRISSVSANQLSALSNLGTLDLARNRVRHLPVLVLRGLTHLILAENRLEAVAASALRDCPALKSLDLSSNLMTSIPSTVFQLGYLENLILAGNRLRSMIPRRLEEVASRGRSGLASLWRLDVSGNNINSIQAGDLLPMWNLHSLDLSRNNISSIAVGTFQRLTRIAYLRLSHNQLTEIGQLFMAVKTLRRLDLSYNKISRFDLTMIPRELKVLDLGFNQLKTLGSYLDVENRIDLRVLNITNNAVRNVSGEIVPRGLQQLIASHNNISVLASDAFTNRSQLGLIDLSYNRLQTLSDYSLKNRALRLGGNPILCDCRMEWLVADTTDIIDRDDVTCSLVRNRGPVTSALSVMSPSMFMCSYETHCFALCHCCDFDACDCEMACPEGCSCFHDMLWNTHTVDCSHQNHSRIPQPLPMDATDVFLDGNDIVSLGNHALIGRTFMRRLFLNNSNIDAVDNKTFNGLSGLFELHLQHNRIQSLVGYEFEDLSSLKRLYLHRNRLKSIDPGVFVPLVKLEELTLHGNHLREFDRWPFAHNGALTFLTLSDNPWSCQCELVNKLRHWLVENFKSIPDAAAIVCSSSGSEPNSVSKRVLTNEVSQEDCKRFQAAVVATSGDVYVSLSLFVVCSAALMLTLVLVVFVFRRQIRLFLYSELGLRVSVPDDGEGSPFDIFVSYGSKDEQLASQIVAELEMGHPSYRCCVLHRDVPSTQEEIRRAASASRRILLLVTHNFLDNEWCHFDFKSVHTEPVVSGRRRMVIVSDDRLPDADIDPEMKLLLKAHPVVRWGEKRFWRSLRYRLPRPRADGPGRAGGAPWRRWFCRSPSGAGRLTRSCSSSELCGPSSEERYSSQEKSVLVCVRTPAAGEAAGSFAGPGDNSRVYYTIDFSGSQPPSLAARPVGNSTTLHTYQNGNCISVSRPRAGSTVVADDVRLSDDVSGGSLAAWSADGGAARERVYENLASVPTEVGNSSEYVPASWVFYSVRRANTSPSDSPKGQTYLV